MSNLKKLKETQVPATEYNEKEEPKKVSPNKVTTIRVTARARDLVNAYKSVTGAANPSEVLEKLVLDAVLELPQAQRDTFNMLLDIQKAKK